jgi:uncharacterized spore protein YtfJ
MEHLERTAHVKTVFGNPIECSDKTIVPVAKVGYGCGAGAGPTGEGQSSEEEEQDGGGGGAGVAASPVGVVEITKDDTRFISISGRKKLVLGFLLGLFVGLLLGRRR